MKIASVDYSTFWLLVSSKNLLPQYYDGGNAYYLFAIEDNISWETVINKDNGSNQLDFEQNHQSNCNQPLEYRSVDGLPKIASSMFVDDLSYWVDGSNGNLTIPASKTVYTRTHFTTPFKLNGVDIHWFKANFGDYINFEIGVYNNNDVSSENNFIQIAQFANQYRIMGTDTKMFQVDTVKTIPSSYDGLDVYVRTTYVNVGLNIVNLCVNLLGYR